MVSSTTPDRPGAGAAAHAAALPSAQERGIVTAAGPGAAGASAAPSDPRGDILAAAEAVLLAEGVEGVSIRKVSGRSGYSAPTIYHHFGDKTGLIDALLEERFRVVYDLMRRTPRGDDAARYLREMGRAFIRFALENPGHYRLLSVPRLQDDDVPSAEAARGLVKQALEQLAAEGTLATDDIEEAFQIAWAMLHGVISLYLLRPNHAFSENLIESSLDVMEIGLLRRDARRGARKRG